MKMQMIKLKNIIITAIEAGETTSFANSHKRYNSSILQPILTKLARTTIRTLQLRKFLHTLYSILLLYFGRYRIREGKYSDFIPQNESSKNANIIIYTSSKKPLFINK